MIALRRRRIWQKIQSCVTDLSWHWLAAPGESGARLDAGDGAANPGAPMVAGLIERTTTVICDEHAPEAVRAAAIARLATLEPHLTGVDPGKLLEPREPLAVQIAAIRALGESDSAHVGPFLVARLRGFEPSVRSIAIQTLLSRAGWTRALLGAMSRDDGRNGLNPGLIEPAERGRLLKDRDDRIAGLAKTLFSQSTASIRACG